MCRTGETYATCSCGASITCAYEFQCQECSAAAWAEMERDDG